MRKVMTVFFILLFSLATAELASAHGHHDRFRGQRHEWRAYRQHRRVRVLGVRYYQQDNYGRRRSAFVHRRNAARRALHRRWHRRADRRWWLRHHDRRIR